MTCGFSSTEKATDGSLQSEDWALNMEICDIINETEEGYVCFLPPTPPSSVRLVSSWGSLRQSLSALKGGGVLLCVLFPICLLWHLINGHSSLSFLLLPAPEPHSSDALF